MNTHGIRQFGLVFLALGTLHASAEIGEFLISEKLISQFQIQTEQQAPFKKKGRLVTPDIDVSLGARLVNDPNQIGFNLDIGLSGSSKSVGFTPVLGNKGVKSVAHADVSARFSQPLTFNGTELSSGKLRGQVDIKPKNLSVSNNFGILNRIVDRKARQQAPQQVRSELPQEKRDLEKQVGEEIEKGIRQAKTFIQNTVDEVQQVYSQARNMPFEQKYSSQAGPNGGAKLQFYEKDDAATRGPKPDFSNKSQIATSGVFHQDLLKKMLTPELAGKEMKIAEIRAVLCADEVKSLINFCETDVPVGTVGLSVIFDEKNPIDFIFENGKVKLIINAKNRVATQFGQEVITKKAGLFSEARASRSGDLEIEPYRVEITYKLEKGRAKLDALTVTDPHSPIVDLPNNKPNPDGHKQSDTLTQLWRRVSDETNSLVKTATRGAIEKEFRKIMREEIEFPTVSLPTKIKVDPKDLTKKPQIAEAGSLIPLEVISENGWLAVSATLCTENTKPLGVVFDKQNRISLVQPNSPADLAGFKVGDRIEAYGAEDTRKTALIRDLEPFFDFVREKAIQKQSPQRTIELTGKSATGIPFSRTVSLCPSTLNHRKGAEELLSQEMRK